MVKPRPQGCGFLLTPVANSLPSSSPVVKNRRIQLSLRSRIYFTMLALIMISFVLTGVTAYFNFRQQNTAYNKERFRRKEKQIKEAMNYLLTDYGGFIPPEQISEVFSGKVLELYDIHGVHVNLYSLRGNLLATSLDASSDTIPSTIEYTIFKQLTSGNDRAETEIEIEHSPSILAYWYYSDAEGRRMAITNVMYDKTQVNKEELSSFLIQLTQIYIILFVGAAILAYFLSNYIVKSLQQIGRKMQQIRVGERNEPLVWSSDDEIGALVNEYNRMLTEVESSAELLAKSERDAAWREMAKQVAHEIKNPLTPMRLRIQHLQRAWLDQADNFDQRLEITAETLIEQIDTLAHIADEFSNFATMPKARTEAVDLAQVMRGVAELFGESESVQVRFSSPLESAPIRADRSQIQRVFNNLVKNAVQAMDGGQAGRVTLTLELVEASYHASVEDNGKGIPEADFQKIFVPNFTTKSTGTGLGLAMTKSIVESVGGTISFRSTPGEGTTFTVTIPAGNQ